MKQKVYTADEPFLCEDGGVIENLKIVYHISAHPRAGQKVVWICHALTANSDPTDWWPQLVGPGKFFDPDECTVVCANMLCSCYGSSGPSSPRGDGLRPYYFDFPRVTVRDIVNAEILLRKHLGIAHIDLLVGGSIGGFQALEWAILEPDKIGHAVFIACGPRVTPWLTAHNEAQRMAIESDSTFQQCDGLQGGVAGLMAARAMALISYRSYAGYNATQSEDSQDTLFADRAASYERYQGLKLAKRFDAYSYWYLTYTVDSHNVGRGRGGVETALRTIQSDCTVIGIDGDGLFPTAEQKYMASCIPGAAYHEITSRFGHDGFLLEYDQLEQILAPIFRNDKNS